MTFTFTLRHHDKTYTATAPHPGLAAWAAASQLTADQAAEAAAKAAADAAASAAAKKRTPRKKKTEDAKPPEQG